jgi:hypothetical protein
MNTLVVQDLDYSAKLDRAARVLVCGGFGTTLFSFDQLFASINHGDINSGVNVSSNGSIFSPTIVTNLALYLPITTVVQLDLDNLVNTDSIIGASFS